MKYCISLYRNTYQSVLSYSTFFSRKYLFSNTYQTVKENTFATFCTHLCYLPPTVLSEAKMERFSRIGSWKSGQVMALSSCPWSINTYCLPRLWTEFAVWTSEWMTVMPSHHMLRAGCSRICFWNLKKWGPTGMVALACAMWRWELCPCWSTPSWPRPSHQQ